MIIIVIMSISVMRGLNPDLSIKTVQVSLTAYNTPPLVIL